MKIQNTVINILTLVSLLIFSGSISFSAEVSTELTLSVPRYLSIEKKTDTLNIDLDDIKNKSINHEYTVQYEINTNDDVDFYCTLKVPVKNGTVNAWNGKTDNGSIVVLANNNGNATAESVLNALNSAPIPSDNADVIAFYAKPSYSKLNFENVINNSLHLSGTGAGLNAGIKVYTSDLRNGTLSEHDTKGIYTAIFDITTVSP